LLLFCLHSAVAAQHPQEMIEETANKVIEKLKEKKDEIDQKPELLYGLINEMVVPHFDFERMSRWVLGKYWRRATPEQRESFVKEFRKLLVRTYASSLSEYSDQKIIYQPFRDKLTDEEVTVRSEVAQPGGFPIPIHYRLHKVGDRWLAYDVLIDDISLVANYRTSFGSEIRSDGLDKLLKKLKERNRQAGA
jgi:phospholipid transport system substrate-binding protein